MDQTNKLMKDYSRQLFVLGKSINHTIHLIISQKFTLSQTKWIPILFVTYHLNLLKFFSHDIYLGKEAMERMAGSPVLILSVVKSVTLHDMEEVTTADLWAQFFLRKSVAMNNKTKRLIDTIASCSGYSGKMA